MRKEEEEEEKRGEEKGHGEVEVKENKGATEKLGKGRNKGPRSIFGCKLTFPELSPQLEFGCEVYLLVPDNDSRRLRDGRRASGGAHDERSSHLSSGTPSSFRLESRKILHGGELSLRFALFFFSARGGERKQSWA